MLDKIPSASEQLNRVRELQYRRMNPPNGQISTELEILSEPALRRQRIVAIEEQRQREEERHRKLALAELVGRLKDREQAEADFAEAICPLHDVTPIDLQIKRKPKFREILLVVCDFYGQTPLDVISARRFNYVVRPRQIICYIAKNTTTLSLPQIGFHLGNRDHTTVLHAIRKIEELMMQDCELADEINYLRARLGNPSDA